MTRRCACKFTSQPGAADCGSHVAQDLPAHYDSFTHGQFKAKTQVACRSSMCLMASYGGIVVERAKQPCVCNLFAGKVSNRGKLWEAFLNKLTLRKRRACGSWALLSRPSGVHCFQIPIYILSLICSGCNFVWGVNERNMFSPLALR